MESVLLKVTTFGHFFPFLRKLMKQFKFLFTVIFAGKISAPVSPKQGQSSSPTNTIILAWATPNNLGGHHLNSLTYKLDYCLKQDGVKFACKTKYEKGSTTSLRGLRPGTLYYISIRALTQTGEQGVPVEIVAKTGTDKLSFILFCFFL